MIYLTGDMHGDIGAFGRPVLKKLKKSDSLIICGDFGFLWSGTPEEEKILKKLTKKKYTILFVDGTHENFDLLSSYPVTQWNGGKVQQIEENIYHLMRGQVFEIEGKKIFTFGGGDCEEKQIYQEVGKWWPQEMPSEAEMQEGLQNLNAVSNQVDYIVTHFPAPRMTNLKNKWKQKEQNHLDLFFEQLSKQVSFQKWFFGYLHLDKKITNSYYTVFNEVIPAEGDR